MALKFKSVFSLMQTKIISGQWPEGHKIPTEMELCEQYGVSRVTIRRALEGLVDRGYLVRTRGRGSYVQFQRSLISPDPIAPLEDDSLGMYKFLKRDLIEATAVDVEELGLSGDEGEQRVWHLRSLHLIDSVPTILSDYYVSPLFGSFIGDLGEESPLSFLELISRATGQQCHFTSCRLAAIIASDEIQTLFGNQGQSANLWCRGYCSLEDGTPIARCSNILNGLQYEFSIDGGEATPLT